MRNQQLPRHVARLRFPPGPVPVELRISPVLAVCGVFVSSWSSLVYKEGKLEVEVTCHAKTANFGNAVVMLRERGIEVEE